MPDRAAIDRTNEVIKYLHALDLAMANAGGFRALLEELDARELSQVTGPQVQAIHMVRAGIVRAAVGTIMACLDPEDGRRNRASVRQILDLSFRCVFALAACHCRMLSSPPSSTNGTCALAASRVIVANSSSESLVGSIE